MSSPRGKHRRYPSTVFELVARVSFSSLGVVQWLVYLAWECNPEVKTPLCQQLKGEERAGMQTYRP
jgi:hypothetical protein